MSIHVTYHKHLHYDCATSFNHRTKQNCAIPHNFDNVNCKITRMYVGKNSMELRHHSSHIRMEIRYLLLLATQIPVSMKIAMNYCPAMCSSMFWELSAIPQSIGFSNFFRHCASGCAPLSLLRIREMASGFAKAIVTNPSRRSFRGFFD